MRTNRRYHYTIDRKYDAKKKRRLKYYKSGYCLKDDTYIKRTYRGKGSKYLKRVCNKRIRHMDLAASDIKYCNGDYRKLTEFWWLLY